jgi:hypothetical protein
MDYFRGFRVLREDPNWLSKLGVGALLLASTMIVPFLGLVAVHGWIALIVRRSVAGEQTPLPRLDIDLNYLGKLLRGGVKAFIPWFVWNLPLGLLIGTTVVCVYVGAVFMAVSVGATPSAGRDAAPIAILFQCVLPVLVIFVAIGAMLVSMPAQMAQVRAEIADDLNQGLQFREVLHMTRVVFRELLISTLILGLLQMVLAFASLLLCGIPLFPVTVAIMVARAHVGAQLYQLYLERGGAPIPRGPLDVENSPPAPPVHAPTGF